MIGWGWLLDRRVLALVGVLALLAVFFVLKQRVEILILERDQANAARVVADATTKAIRRESILITGALDNAREADHERHQQITENAKRIERARTDGDGPVDPVLRDTAEFLRDRYRDVSARRNP